MLRIGRSTPLALLLIHRDQPLAPVSAPDLAWELITTASSGRATRIVSATPTMTLLIRKLGLQLIEIVNPRFTSVILTKQLPCATRPSNLHRF